MPLIKDHVFLLKRGSFKYIDEVQPEIDSYYFLVESNKYYKDQLLFETKETDEYTHVAINKNNIKDIGLTIREDKNKKSNNPLFLILLCVNTNIGYGYFGSYGYCGVEIKFKWEYINCLREKYLDAVKTCLKSVNSEDTKRFYNILTENLSETERLYLDL